MKVIISLMLPSHQLSPNARNHWIVVAKAKRYYRELAAIQCRNIYKGAPVKAALLQPVFFFKDKRRRDKDNLLASLKAAFDGLADGGLVRNDSDITYLPIVIAIDKSRPRVELHVTEDE